MLTSWLPIDEGENGIRQIVDRLGALRDYYGALPVIRSAAIAIAGGNQDDDDQGNVDRLASFVRTAVIYQKDPLNAEFVQAPDVMLLNITKRGYTYGDCDDHVLLFASLAESLGVRTAIAGVKLESGSFNHVIAVPAIEDRNLIDVDLCAKHGEALAYAEKILA